MDVQPSAGKQGSLTSHGYWAKQTLSLWKFPPSSFIAQFYMLSMMPYSLGYPGVPSYLLLHPQPTLWWWGVSSRKRLGSVWALSSNGWNIPELPTVFPAQILHIAPKQLLGRKLTLPQPTPVILGVMWCLPVDNGQKRRGSEQQSAAVGIWGARSIFETSKSGVGGGKRTGITRFKRGHKIG